MGRLGGACIWDGEHFFEKKEPIVCFVVAFVELSGINITLK